MTASLGLSNDFSYFMIKSAGVGEVFFGLVFFVTLMQPHILIEVFNPVTTNIAIIGFSLIILLELRHETNSK